jgi:hypothetical protein
LAAADWFGRLLGHSLPEQQAVVGALLQRPLAAAGALDDATLLPRAEA